ncbi:MAG: hypothetical protein EKK57_07245 [Proteobacteria bacterium]|nr:MAG: hypothetical protein EKK57_07245 [Pseudomonadota bacterium]
MLIKVSLSQAELRAIVAAHLGVKQVDLLEIKTEEQKNTEKYLNISDCNEFQNLGLKYRNKPDQKIPWIRELRTLLNNHGFNNGLAYSKFAVENWDNFLNYLWENRRAPKDIRTDGAFLS